MLIETVRTATPRRRRNYAMVLVLARLGLWCFFSSQRVALRQDLTRVAAVLNGVGPPTGAERERRDRSS